MQTIVDARNAFGLAPQIAHRILVHRISSLPTEQPTVWVITRHLGTDVLAQQVDEALRYVHSATAAVFWWPDFYLLPIGALNLADDANFMAQKVDVRTLSAAASPKRIPPKAHRPMNATNLPWAQLSRAPT
nr:hypothetical protein [Mycobacterium sp. ACS1612]